MGSLRSTKQEALKERLLDVTDKEIITIRKALADPFSLKERPQDPKKVREIIKTYSPQFKEALVKASRGHRGILINLLSCLVSTFMSESMQYRGQELEELALSYTSRMLEGAGYLSKEQLRREWKQCPSAYQFSYYLNDIQSINVYEPNIIQLSRIDRREYLGGRGTRKIC